MKKVLTIVSVALVALVLSSCVENSKKYQTLLAEKEQLAQENQKMEQEFNTTLGILNEVENNLQAIRDAEGEVSVHQGDYVGYSGKQMLSDSPSRVEAAMELCRKLGAASRDVMLVFYGKDVPAEEAEVLTSNLQKEFKNLEIILNSGLQPVYDYIFVLC